MKKVTLFSTGCLMYLTELPILYLLYISIKHNSGVEGPIKLYPLILALIGGAVFILIYLFRIITISTDMIKAAGPYSSKEKALITEGKTLVLTLLAHGKVKVELFGVDETPPLLSWTQTEEYQKIEVNLFRDRAVGGAGAVRRVLKYFNVPDEDIKAALVSESFSSSYQSIELLSERREDIREIKIKFTETI